MATALGRAETGTGQAAQGLKVLTFCRVFKGSMTWLVMDFENSAQAQRGNSRDAARCGGEVVMNLLGAGLQTGFRGPRAGTAALSPTARGVLVTHRVDGVSLV